MSSLQRSLTRKEKRQSLKRSASGRKEPRKCVKNKKKLLLPSNKRRNKKRPKKQRNNESRRNA